MTQNNMEVVAWRLYDAVIDAKSLADEYKKDGWPVEPLVTLSSAQAEIAVQKQANEALMRERANMIKTHREQLERLNTVISELSGEVDILQKTSSREWAKNGGTEIALGQWKARAEAAEKERDALREALRKAAPPYEEWMDKYQDNIPSGLYMQQTFGDIRRAAALLQPLEPKND